jgi:Tol biopolymer transport system component
LARVEYPIGTKIYESRGRLQGVSVSPGGDRVALLESPDEAAGINSVVVVDRKGKSSVLSRGWRDARKTRWSPDGTEVWFSAGEGGGSSALHAVDLRGRHRIVLRLPGRMTLYDVSRAGAVLLARDVVRTQAVGLPPGEATERDLTWLDGSWAIDLSPDGRSLLLREEGEGGGPGGALYLRTTDGATAVRLGEGSGFALSPDGRWVLSMTRESPARLVLLPTGAGEAKHLEQGPIHEYRAGYWFPDGRRLLLCAAESGRPPRLYLQEVGGGPPVALTPEGTDTAEVFANPISPDGARIFALSPQRRVTLYPVAGGEPREVAGLEPGEAPIRWSADGRALFVYRSPALPARVYLLDLASGQRRFWKEIVPADPFGAHRLIRVLPTPDGRAYVYSYRRTLSDLYLVEGVG